MIRNRIASPRRLAALLAIGAASVAAAPAVAAEPAIVGEYEPLTLKAGPLASDQMGGPAWERVVQFPGATYVRLHFSSMDLGAADRVEISTPDGSLSWSYSGRGPHGTGAFWAHSVPGDTVLVRLHASGEPSIDLEIDGAGRGRRPVHGGPRGGDEPSPSGMVCGSLDWRDVACYEPSHPVEVGHARAAVLALVGCCSVCTAFKVSDSGLFLTSRRCGPVASAELFLDFQRRECDAGLAQVSGSVLGGEALVQDSTLDYVLFSTLGDTSAIPCLQLDRRLPPLGERIYIPGHPLGAAKKLAIESDQDSGGLCAVGPLGIGGQTPATDIGYLCDTGEQSLGSPVLSAETRRVVGIHHYGGCPNSASRMDLIQAQIADFLDGCSAGSACRPLGMRCNCDGRCSSRERRYVDRGGVCADCSEGGGPSEPGRRR